MKWASSVITTALISSAWSQIQTSLIGMGVSACFNACLTAAYTSAVSCVTDSVPTVGRCYERRRPEKTPLHKIVSENVEIWLEWRDRAEQPVEAYVEEKLRGYLECGLLCFGFARARCTGCGRKSTRPGATGVVELTPFEFLERLADLVLPPWKHRHRSHGVFAPNHRLRKTVTALAIGNVGMRQEAAAGGHGCDGSATASGRSRPQAAEAPGTANWDAVCADARKPPPQGARAVLANRHRTADTPNLAAQG